MTAWGVRSSARRSASVAIAVLIVLQPAHGRLRSDGGRRRELLQAPERTPSVVLRWGQLNRQTLEGRCAALELRAQAVDYAGGRGDFASGHDCLLSRRMCQAARLGDTRGARHFGQGTQYTEEARQITGSAGKGRKSEISLCGLPVDFQTVGRPLRVSGSALDEP